MIPEQWYAILESRELPRGRPRRFRRLGMDLAFWRDASGAAHAVLDRCPHRGASLAAGDVAGENLRCPFHGFEFDGDGACRYVPANGHAAPPQPQLRAQSIPVAEAAGFLFAWSGEPNPDLPAPRFFEDLDGLAHATTRDPWAIHYSRAIENQLDVAHLPFVHHNTIGRGGRTLVDGPRVDWLGPDRFRVQVFNRLDDGSPPRRAEDLAGLANPFWLDFLFPNLWQNHISETTRVVIAFAPIDDGHCQLYLRFYQGFLRNPTLGRLAAWLALPVNRFIAHQDRRVVETQRPLASELRGGEKLIQADGPIVAYRRRRQDLLDAAARAPGA